MENIYKVSGVVEKLDWRNKGNLYLTDFITRRCGVLIKKILRVSSIDLAMFLDIEHEELLNMIDIEKYLKATYKYYQPGELDASKYDKKFDFYWINSEDIEKILMELKERM
nr:hypothetical protein [uncultured Romboutsia sp.]